MLRSRQKSLSASLLHRLQSNHTDTIIHYSRFTATTTARQEVYRRLIA